MLVTLWASPSKKASVTIIVFLMMVADMGTAFVQSEEENKSMDGILDGKKTVRVKNDLKNGIVIYLHCRSKNDDLGQHSLVVGEQQEWSFKDNIFDSTLFWCTLDAGNWQFKFEIYSAKRDTKCTTECDRSIRSDGAYFWNQLDKVWEKRFSWSIN
ncbi:hypothetical protein Fmac_003669 [Flemingia macrophylla]|uniref:S-protein homolog n=1 Tax=Flemingia macrophylla TaxID=520843 RepID=A0ABD1N2T6_9FABA